MRFGLSENIIEEIILILSKYQKIESVIIFGSRAKGNYSNGSDIDLAVKGNSLSFDEFIQIQTEFDQLELLYKIDFIDYTKINEPALKEHIDSVGKFFYKSDKSIHLSI
ncbi:MAG: hypothetical protein A2309_02005 [Bacteroidetes bacterium RIFOXYB2_FULL_35_7]|nr:MAG: hypothetical protein A2X01_20455 [Bacteroidetes bacterium GWF2_35_48]OFY93672.1 MAG: hypothetical protein A2491_00900 [Bacteroidetes bacterium RIFOXYC12_FULL_35_7]OFY96386.1 MAG: hypothetical protein A2309_02005 [Bacteroidetes bacterium RIFOXYB2_FULL_35_7]HBX50259.1 hypothetical protein [Bacteroidales bacterium]